MPGTGSGSPVPPMTSSLPTPDAYWVPSTYTNFAPPAGRLLAGEYPGAKEAAEAEKKLGRYLDTGVTLFLDLTEDGEYHLRPYANTVRHLAVDHGRSVTHHRLSIPDMGTPQPEQMTQILNTLDNALVQGETVYVHCFGGIGRTGTVIGCWLVRHGLTGAEALEKITDWRRGTPDGWKQSPETPDQRQMVLNWREVNP